MAQFEISDKKVMTEAWAIIDETFETDQLEMYILKLLRKYKQHVDCTGHVGWYNIEKLVTKEMMKQLHDADEAL